MRSPPARPSWLYSAVGPLMPSGSAQRPARDRSSDPRTRTPRSCTQDSAGAQLCRKRERKLGCALGSCGVGADALGLAAPAPPLPLLTTPAVRQPRARPDQPSGLPSAPLVGVGLVQGEGGGLELVARGAAAGRVRAGEGAAQRGVGAARHLRSHVTQTTTPQAQAAVRLKLKATIRLKSSDKSSSIFVSGIFEGRALRLTSDEKIVGGSRCRPAGSRRLGRSARRPSTC